MTASSLPFVEFTKIPRLNREMTLTEKIDGTNGCIVIDQHPFGTHVGGVPEGATLCLNHDVVSEDGLPTYEYLVYAQSRNRVVTAQSDNHDFAKWVALFSASLLRDLGAGRHFGEWWGLGIQGRYSGRKFDRSFSLFNTSRWSHAAAYFKTPTLSVVPVLYEGPFDSAMVDYHVEMLRETGSVVCPGAKAEGVVVYHKAANSLFKVTCEKDEEPKSAR